MIKKSVSAKRFSYLHYLSTVVRLTGSFSETRQNDASHIFTYLRHGQTVGGVKVILKIKVFLPQFLEQPFPKKLFLDLGAKMM